MTDSSPSSKDVRNLRGLVVRRAYATGSKSERDAVMLDTASGTFVLRMRRGPSFGHTGFEALVGRTVECDGTLVDERLLLVDRVEGRE